MRILILNQAFYPDTIAVGYYAADLAQALARQGHQVVVLASRRGYDNPAVRFRAREQWRGIQIVRLPCFAFGKGSRWRRALDYGSFLVSCSLELLAMPRFDVVVAMTTPPLIAFLGGLFVRLKGGQMVSWTMDLNPDQAIAAGWLEESSRWARFLKWALRQSLERPARIVVLDRFMRDRLCAKGVPPEKVSVIAPWSQDDSVRYDRQARQAFRARHGLAGKFVVMYAGNHSPCHPLETLLEAARRLSTDPRIAFCFVGGGTKFPAVKKFAGRHLLYRLVELHHQYEFPAVKKFAERHGLNNITCLPYQPLETLSSALSAADLHVVVMGDPFVGIVHPCKIYNVLRVGIPFLYIGPPESHVRDLLPDGAEQPWAFLARHGQVERVVSAIQRAASGQAALQSAAELGLAAKFSSKSLLPLMLDVVLSATEAGREEMSRSALRTGCQ